VARIAPNLLKYYLLRLLSGLIFTYVIQVIYLLSRGITVSQLALYASLTIILSTLFEIPTGYIADKFGRKYSVALSYLCSSLAFVALIFVQAFTLLIGVSFLNGLSRALESGALESLMYEEVQSSGAENDFLKVTSRGSNIAIIAAAGASFVSPSLYLLNPSIPFILSGVSNLVMAVLILLFDEKQRAHEVLRNIRVIDGIRNVVRIRPILLIVLIDLLLLIFVNVYYQISFFPKITALGLDIRLLGVVDVVTLGITSVILLWLPRLRWKNEKTWLVVFSLAAGIVFVIFGLSTTLWAALVFGVLFDPMWHLRAHVIPTITNKYFESSSRALSLSSMSFISNLGAALLLPVAIQFFDWSYLFSLVPLGLIGVLLAVYPNTKSG